MVYLPVEAHIRKRIGPQSRQFGLWQRFVNYTAIVILLSSPLVLMKFCTVNLFTSKILPIALTEMDQRR